MAELSDEDLIFQYLSRSRVQEDTLRYTIIPHLTAKGFCTVGDLQDLKKKYLEHKNITELDRDRILRLVSKTKDEEFNMQATKSQANVNENIYIRYILCKELFSVDNTESTIDDIKPTIRLKEIVSTIHSKAQLSSDEVIELYSSEGYPLHNNELTNMESLIRWGICDGDLLFAIIRPKDQPGQLQFATLPKVDHDTGEEKFTIETPFQEEFIVKAYIDSDSPEDIAQKIYSITDIPVPFMSLYVRQGCTYERLNTFTELKDNDIIRVVLRNPQEVATPRSPHYGLHSYSPHVTQTQKGMSKFYSILKFLCSLQPYNEEYEFEKFVSYLLNITEFPPLVHALCTLRERSYLTIAGWAALIEPLFFLFKSILTSYITVSDDKIFEYSDYTCALLIRLSKGVGTVDNIERSQHSLVCPLSEKRICTPVQIQSNSDLGSFDKTNCLFKISNSENFSNFGIKYEVSPDDLLDDEETARYLMYYPWESDDKILTWKNPPTQSMPATCNKVSIQTTWNEMVNSLEELCIVHPLGLYAGSECLTFIQQARLVYFLGAAKGTDETRRLFDPCHIPKKSPYQPNPDKYVLSLSKQELRTIGNAHLEGLLFHDISSTLKIACSPQEKTQSTKVKDSAIVQPERSIQWEPEEAIVVLLDYSGSMSCSIYSDRHLRRIDAAKELFNAFATRTQAYKLHHAFGLTLYDHETDRKLPLTKNVEDFEDSLQDVETRGGTDIPGAILDAVRQLSAAGYRSTCTKRILCLTDGEDYCSYEEALRQVQANYIVVDTILLMSPDVGNPLKALSHASGGACVCPSSMQEALKLFELDPFLSLKMRIKSTHPKSLSGCSNTPFETEKSFQSLHSQSYKNLSTISAKSYIDRDRSSGQTNVLPRQKRIIKELREFLHAPHNGIKVYPSEHEYAKWKVLMRGPEGTPYESGAFILSIEFPDKYPTVPPELKFITPIYHCNISASSGRICHSVLGEAYTPAISIKELLCHIYGLLMSPDMDNILDSVLADEFGYLRHQEKDLDKTVDTDKFFGAAEVYFQKARDHVHTHASKSFEEWDREMS